MNFAMVMFPRMTQLDLTGPFEIFRRMPSTTIALIAATRDAVCAEGGLAIVPTATFADAAQCDVLFVPGGKGADTAMSDDAVLEFVRRQAEGAKWITSVCTGALILGAAGLLEGYRATTHRRAFDRLPDFGAIPVRERVVRDRNRMTSAGVTAGIDFALRMAAELHGAEVAEQIQMAIEYE